MLQLAYLADILSYLSHLDISLQGCDKKNLLMGNKVNASLK
jgi:hypothetical protein